MKKRYIPIFIFISVVLLCSSKRGVAQTTEEDNTITVESVVKDENGNPVRGAIIYGNEGAVVTTTDASGKFTISVPDHSNLLIEGDGYESALFKEGEYKNLTEFSLKASVFGYSEKDGVNVAFGKVKKGDLVNAVSVLQPTDILQYDNVLDISQALAGRIPGLLGSSNVRGIGAPLFVVDGLPSDISTVNLAEVEQITVLKDINSSILYGNAAVNGVVLITTKKGQPYKKQVKVTGYYGVSKPAALPKYLSSSDYAQLYNEARVNDGLAPQYDDATIENYRSGNPYIYPNTNYYSSEYLAAFKPFSRIMTELSGGDEVVSYYSNLGWDQTGSLLDFGAGESSKRNIFNTRGNVDVKINHWIRTSLNAVAVFNNYKTPVGDYWSDASTLHPNLLAPLVPISFIDPENVLLKARKYDLDGKYLLGGTGQYLTNPISDGYSGGVNENIQRTFSFNNRVDFDLDDFVKGLSFHSNGNFAFYSRYDQAIRNQYSVYEPVWNAAGDSILSVDQYGDDIKTGSQEVGNTFYSRRFGYYASLDYDRTFGDHHITGALLGMATNFKEQTNIQGNKNSHMGLRLGYTFKNKYVVDFSGAYVHSVKLPEGNRNALSPSLALAWVISSEGFMSGVSAIDYLKLRVSGGVTNSDAGIDGFYYYDNIYTTGGSYSWFENGFSNSGSVSSYGGNSQLFFEKRNEINVGFEGLFFDGLLGMDANFFTSGYADQVTRPQTLYPDFYFDYVPYENFNEDSYRGVELGLSLNRNIGQVSFTVGANGLYANSEVLRMDEIYANPYQYRRGRPVDALFGLVADGLFMDEAEIANHPVQAFGTVKPGDIKYVDQNDDNIIDVNDEVQIGRSQPTFSYGLNLKVSFKNFTLFALGTGSTGSNAYIGGNYYWVDGNDKYSEYALNRWTEATKTTATYPRLSSLASTNNFRNSTFWMYRDNYFSLDRMQLTFDMPYATSRALRMQKLSLFVSGSQLLNVSKNKEIRELRVGTEPYYRSFSVGVKTVF